MIALYIVLGIVAFLLLLLLVEYIMWRKVEVVCAYCGHMYKPKFTKFLFSWHFNWTILLTCPDCGKSNGHHIETI